MCARLLPTQAVTNAICVILLRVAIFYKREELNVFRSHVVHLNDTTDSVADARLKARVKTGDVAVALMLSPYESSTVPTAMCFGERMWVLRAGVHTDCRRAHIEALPSACCSELHVTRGCRSSGCTGGPDAVPLPQHRAVQLGLLFAGVCCKALALSWRWHSGQARTFALAVCMRSCSLVGPSQARQPRRSTT